MGTISGYLSHLFEIRASLLPFQQKFPFSKLAVLSNTFWPWLLTNGKTSWNQQWKSVIKPLNYFCFQKIFGTGFFFLYLTAHIPWGPKDHIKIWDFFKMHYALYLKMRYEQDILEKLIYLPVNIDPFYMLPFFLIFNHIPDSALKNINFPVIFMR